MKLKKMKKALKNLEKGLKREMCSIFRTEKLCFSSVLENEILKIDLSKSNKADHK